VGYQNISRWDGTAWTDSPYAAELHGLWGRVANDVWAVGLNGAIVHWDGTQWSQEESGTAAELDGIAGSSTDAWAWGQNGVILHKKLLP
jgi:hypothetical protein